MLFSILNLADSPSVRQWSLNRPYGFIIHCFSPGTKCSMYGSEKVYLGVRVKMPVRDLLKNVRLAQGWEPQEFKVISLEI